MAASPPGCTPAEGNRRPVPLIGAGKPPVLAAGLEPEMAFDGEIEIVRLREATGPHVVVVGHLTEQHCGATFHGPIAFELAIALGLDSERAVARTVWIDGIVPGEIPGAEELLLDVGRRCQEAIEHAASRRTRHLGQGRAR